MLDCLSGNVRTEGLVEALPSVLMIRLLGDKTRKEILWHLTIHVSTPSCSNLMLQEQGHCHFREVASLDAY